MNTIENNDEELQRLVEQELNQLLTDRNNDLSEDAELYRLLFSELAHINPEPIDKVEDIVIQKLLMQEERRDTIRFVALGGLISIGVLLLTFAAAGMVNAPIMYQTFSFFSSHIPIIVFIFSVIVVIQLLDKVLAKRKMKLNV